jgi:hypothetical protein
MSEQRVPLPIENCRRWFRFLCPQTWSQLERTTQLDVRHCPSCRRDVYYCDTREAVEEHRQAGHCVCVEARARTEDEDLIEYIGEPGSDA